MAASYVTAVRTLLKGVHIASGWFQSKQTTALSQCWRLQAAQCRPLSVSAASLCSSRTEPQRGSSTDHSRDQEEAAGPEYIPQRKAKNPMLPIGYAWMIGLPSGIIIFILAKRQVDKNRLKQLKIRERMRRSNDGEYESSRFRTRTGS
ncbi:DUF4748 domain-containing protein [Betta splendens]|uniref:DUF4748 domain-containing protein n=1 Tax=Betta splendens TaxID=158456 RepID=A0A8M1H6G4_BETSP|nr:DUF4748 domain-containing protein [Betta splendens]